MNSDFLNANNKNWQINDGEKLLNQSRLSILGRLIPIIVHEVNNPIQAISGAASLAKEDILDEKEVANYLTLIQEESRRVLSLTSFVRSLYLPSQDHKKQIDLTECINGLMPIVKDDFNRNGITLSYDPPKTPIMIQGDLAEIQLALIESMLNLNSWLNARNYKNYQIKIFTEEKNAIVEFIVDIGELEDYPFNLSVLETWLTRQGGKLLALVAENLNIMRFELPLINNVRL